MEKSVFRFALRFSLRQQITLVLIALAAQPFYIYSLQIPKDIINRVIEAKQPFPQSYLYLEGLERTDLLVILCGIFLTMVLLTGGLKYATNVYAGIVGERMLRRLRFNLIERALRFPPSQFRKVSSGEVVSMVTLETEPLGGFVAEMASIPALQGGLLLSALGFIMAQDWKMGLAAIALFPIQIYLIPKLQRRVNLLGKDRIQAVRRLSERVGEVVGATQDVHANDMSHRVLADFSSRLGAIYWIRLEIYKKKFFIKFLNNFLAQLTPFFFFAIGGYMVIQGDLSSGALVAALVAYKDLSPPVKELLAFYQRTEDARIKYEQLLQQFQPDGMMDDRLVKEEPAEMPRLAGPIVGSNVSYADPDGVRAVDGASFLIDPEARAMLVGPGGSGKDELARVIARQLAPTGGRIAIHGHDLSSLPVSVTGRRIAYVGSDSSVFQGTLMENLLSGVMNRMRSEPVLQGAEAEQYAKVTHEARESGNSPDDLRGEWIDYHALGIDGAQALNDAALGVLDTVELESDLYALGLLRTVDPKERPDLADRLLMARQRLRERLKDPGFAPFVEPFDEALYNTNASVGENILYGTPVGDTFAEVNLARHPYMRKVLGEVGLIDEFLAIGHKAAETMVELFSDLPPGHRFFEQYGFIEHDDLEDFQSILRRIEQNGLTGLSEEDRGRLMELPFRLIPSRHRLGLIEDDMQERLLEARRLFAKELPDDLRDKIDFYDVERYNAAAPIEVNILFGRVAYGRAGAAERVRAVVAEILDDLELRSDIVDLALQAPVGVNGNRLGATQRQKLVLARALMKKPDLIIVNEALSALDRDRQAAIRTRIGETYPDATLIWVDSQRPETNDYHKLIVMRGGKIEHQEDFVPYSSLGGEDTAADQEAAAAEQERSLRVLSDEELQALPEAERDIHLLRRIPMFATLDWSNLRLLASTCEKLTYDPGDVLFRQGDDGDAMYVVTSGDGEIFISEGEQENVIRSIGVNEVIGEVALLTDEPRSASIRATSRMDVIRMSRTTFVELVKEHSEISFQLIRELAMRLFETTRRFETLMNEHRKTVGW